MRKKGDFKKIGMIVKNDNHNKQSDLRWEKFMLIGAKFGCHQMPERSFFIHGYQFPVCARCTGLVIGHIIALLTWFSIYLSPVCSGIICFPLLIDGLTQYVGWRESNQILRIITGILCGVGSMRLGIILITAIVKLISGGLFR